jgi:hypothetical protein
VDGCIVKRRKDPEYVKEIKEYQHKYGKIRRLKAKQALGLK